MERHIRQHGGIHSIRGFNDIMSRREPAGNSTVYFTRNQHGHVLQRASAYFIGTNVHRYAGGKHKLTLAHRGAGYGTAHVLRNEQAAASLFDERPGFIYNMPIYNSRAGFKTFKRQF